MFPPTPFYPNNDNHTPAVFDLRYPGVAERLHRERAAWQEHNEIEAIAKDHPVLIVLAGGASRLAA